MPYDFNLPANLTIQEFATNLCEGTHYIFWMNESSELGVGDYFLNFRNAEGKRFAVIVPNGNGYRYDSSREIENDPGNQQMLALQYKLKKLLLDLNNEVSVAIFDDPSQERGIQPDEKLVQAQNEIIDYFRSKMPRFPQDGVTLEKVSPALARDSFTYQLTLKMEKLTTFPDAKAYFNSLLRPSGADTACSSTGQVTTESMSPSKFAELMGIVKLELRLFYASAAPEKPQRFCSIL